MPVSNEELKHLLMEERSRLREQVGLLSGVEYHGGGCGNHIADDATETYEQAKDLSLQRNEASLLWQVEHALQKFEQGIFGICEVCGAPIDPARLQALPYAICCLSCQSRVERRG